MKPARFIYHRPDTLAEALALLAEYGDEAKVLAGGQSLIPLLAMRMGRAAHVVDIGRIPGLGEITVRNDASVNLGALVRHAGAERSAEIAERAPLIHEALPFVAHRAIRTRGTVVGSIAHADPAAEMPAVALATGATMTATSRQGERSIPASEFFEGYLQTVLRPDEILTSVTFPAWPSNAVGSVVEVSRRHGDYALVGLVAKLELDGDTITDAVLAYFGAASTAVRVTEAEQALVGSHPTAEAFARAGIIASERLSPPADIHGTTAYRQHLARVLTQRGLTAATTTIGAPA